MNSKKTRRDLAVATVILLFLFSTAILNALLCSRQLDKLSREVTDTEQGDLEAATAIRKRFDSLSFFLSITVNHDDLEEAKAYLLEFTIATEYDDAATLEIAKSRFIAALGQLKRLCGFGIDSII